jgi:hypothetical protein
VWSGVALRVAGTPLKWAPARLCATCDAPLWSAGLGFSFFDGLLRVDAATPVRGGRWPMHLSLDGVL